MLSNVIFKEWFWRLFGSLSSLNVACSINILYDRRRSPLSWKTKVFTTLLIYHIDWGQICIDLQISRMLIIVVKRIKLMRSWRPSILVRITGLKSIDDHYALQCLHIHKSLINLVLLDPSLFNFITYGTDHLLWAFKVLNRWQWIH